MDWKNLTLTYQPLERKDIPCQGPIVEIIQDKTPLIVMNVVFRGRAAVRYPDNAFSWQAPPTASIQQPPTSTWRQRNYFTMTSNVRAMPPFTSDADAVTRGLLPLTGEKNPKSGCRTPLPTEPNGFSFPPRRTTARQVSDPLHEVN
jgi:hypothetical protein